MISNFPVTSGCAVMVISGVGTGVASAEAETSGEAEAAGADFVGLIFEPSSPRAVTLAEAAKIAGCLSGSAKAVGVFVSQTPEFIARAAEECGLSAIQLHGGISSECADLPDFSGCEIWRAVWLESLSDVGTAEAARCAAVVADSRSGSASGGTGKLSDWGLRKDDAEKLAENSFAAMGALYLLDPVELTREDACAIISEAIQ